MSAGFAAQCRQAWANVAAALSHHGMGLSGLKVTTYLSDLRYRDENFAIRWEMLGGHCPAPTVIVAGIYDEAWLVEMEALAAV
ncbi:RidA family protein [Frankia sp. Cpl3]|uniref:RidA family protein n=1 Tax=Parafrankia colletiae TaxID=573497 RepID=UPI0010427AD2|nr:RidA family protein [Parafrankia colletiae]MCK9904628.1 RidA family protein [Frankia sp. Cpl3]